MSQKEGSFKYSAERLLKLARIASKEIERLIDQLRESGKDKHVGTVIICGEMLKSIIERIENNELCRDTLLEILKTIEFLKTALQNIEQQGTQERKHETRKNNSRPSDGNGRKPGGAGGEGGMFEGLPL